MLKKKLAKAEALVAEQMLAIVEWASDNPTKWHKIGNLEATQKAAERTAGGARRSRDLARNWPL